MEEHVVEVKERVVLQPAEAHEDQQPRHHQPDERSVAERDAERSPQHLAKVLKLALDGGNPVGHQQDRREHRGHEDHRDREDRRAPAEVREQQSRADGAACDADQVCDSVVAGSLTPLRLGHDVRQQALVRRLPVAAGERDSGQKEQVARRAGSDERSAPAPPRNRAVGDSSDDRLPDDRNQGAERFQQARRDAFVLAPDELDDHVGQDQRSQAVPQVADRDPVERQDDEVDGSQSRLRRRRFQSGWNGGSDLLTGRSSR